MMVEAKVYEYAVESIRHLSASLNDDGSERYPEVAVVDLRIRFSPPMQNRLGDDVFLTLRVPVTDDTSLGDLHRIIRLRAQHVLSAGSELLADHVDSDGYILAK